MKKVIPIKIMCLILLSGSLSKADYGRGRPMKAGEIKERCAYDIVKEKLKYSSTLKWNIISPKASTKLGQDQTWIYDPAANFQIDTDNTPSPPAWEKSYISIPKLISKDEFRKLAPQYLEQYARAEKNNYEIPSLAASVEKKTADELAKNSVRRDYVLSYAQENKSFADGYYFIFHTQNEVLRFRNFSVDNIIPPYQENESIKSFEKRVLNHQFHTKELIIRVKKGWFSSEFDQDLMDVLLDKSAEVVVDSSKIKHVSKSTGDLNLNVSSCQVGNNPEQAKVKIGKVETIIYEADPDSFKVKYQGEFLTAKQYLKRKKSELSFNPKAQDQRGNR